MNRHLEILNPNKAYKTLLMQTQKCLCHKAFFVVRLSFLQQKVNYITLCIYLLLKCYGIYLWIHLSLNAYNTEKATICKQITNNINSYFNLYFNIYVFHRKSQMFEKNITLINL